MATLTSQTVIQMVEGYCKPPSTSSGALPIVSTKLTNATSKFKDENNTQGSTNISIYATGRAATSDTRLKKSNMTISHACDSSTYVGGMVKQIGVMGGKIVQAIREGIQFILKALGFTPSSSGIISKLQYFAEWLKNRIDDLKEISDFLQGYILYVADIRKFIAFLLSLPACLITYFQDCLATLRKQLVAGFKSALSSMSDPSDLEVKELTDTIDEVKKDLTTLQTTAQQVVTDSQTLFSETAGLVGDIAASPESLVSAAASAAQSAATTALATVAESSAAATSMASQITTNPVNLTTEQVSNINLKTSMA